MPTPRKKIRTYCKSCEEFKIHDQVQSLGEDLKLSCSTCNTIGTPYKWEDLDYDKIQDQRIRYKRSQTQAIGRTMNTFLSFGMAMELDELRLVEDDAGQKDIDEQLKQDRLKAIEERRVEVEHFNETYKPLGRNDKCACGSGKKYKQCHLPIFQERKLGR